MSHHITSKLDCVTCMLHTALKIIKAAPNSPKQKNDALISVIRFLRVETDVDIPPIQYASKMFHLIGEELGVSDPFITEKQISNKIALQLVPQFSQELAITPQPLKFEKALRIAISGNVIDFGTAQNEIDFNHLRSKIESVLQTIPVINHTSKFLNAIKKASTLLYLCDNAGEIALDKPLLTIVHQINPQIRITAVVKDGPISNDATLKDAHEVGLDKVVDEIITTGSADLGINQENASPEMKKALEISDFVIAKGQSNIESLWDNIRLRRGPIGFLLVAKCGVIANALNVPIDSPIILFSDPK